MKALSFTNVDNEGKTQNSTDLHNLDLLHSFGIGYRHDPYSYFPPQVTREIWDIVEADYPPDDMAATVPCSYLQNSSTFDFTFASINKTNITFHVPLSDLTLHTGEGPNLDQGADRGCQLAIKSTPPGLPNYFSMRMVKSLYLLFDLKNKIISAALTNFNATEDKIIALPTGGLGEVPTAALGIGNPNEPTSTADANPQPGGGTNEKALRISLAVAIPVFIIALFVALYVFYKRRDKKWARKAGAREERERVEALRAEARAKEVPVHQMNPESEQPEPESEKAPRASGVSELPADPGHGMGERRDSQAHINAGEIHELG